MAGGGLGIADRTAESALRPSTGGWMPDRWLAGVSFAIARGEWTDPARSRVTVGDWSRQWLTAKAPSLKATTRESYRSILKTCIWPTWERIPLAAVTHSDVAAWVARLSAQMGASRCRKSAILLSGIMSAAVRDQRISRNPCDGVSLPRLPNHRQRFLTMAELQDLADRAGAYRLMILVLGLCGLRFGECAALCVRSVDLMRRRLRGVRVGVRDHWAHDLVHPEDAPVTRRAQPSVTDRCLGCPGCGQEARGCAL